MYDHMSFGMSGFMWIFWLVPFGLIIWGAIVVADSRKEQNNSKQNNDSLNILQERYARGDINKQEYEEKYQDLQKHRGI